MPTGYTAKLAQGPQSFEDFVWSAARAMGALVMMRDEPTGAPIPERFEPSDYHIKRLREAKAESLRLRAMTEEEADAAAEREYGEAHARWLERQSANAAQRERYEAMAREVVAWKPPTGDHQGFKDFMLEQLASSIKFDCYEPEEPEKRPGLVWQAEGIAKAERDIDYHAKEHQAEVARTESRNRWLAALRRSVPGTDQERPK